MKMEAPEVSCPQCKSNSYINPGMKIFVSPCYHSLCAMCISRLFSNGPNKCPECEVTLRKSNYTSQTFEDVEVERECRIRKLVAQQVGKTLEDFSDDEDYNEYLEKIEEVVQALVELKTPKEVTERLQEFKEELSLAGAKPTTPESVKRRKVDPGSELGVPSKKYQLEYFFPTAAIDHSTVPPQVLHPPVCQMRSHYEELINAMIQKASAALVSTEL